MTSLRLAWLNLVRHRAATLLAVFAIALTIACAGILLRLSRLADQRFSGIAVAGDALIAAKGSSIDAMLGLHNAEGPYPRFIPMRLFATLVDEAWYAAGNRAHASSVIPFLYCGRYESGIRPGRAHRVLGTIGAFFDMPEPAPGLAFAEGEWTDRASDIVLGANVARREGLRVGDTLRVEHWVSDDMPKGVLRPRYFKVSGILEPMGNAWDGVLFAHLLRAQEMVEEGLAVAGQQTQWKGFVLNYVLLHAQPGKLDSLGAMIDQQTVTQVVPLAETRASLLRIAGTGRSVGLAVALVALFLAATTLLAVMLGRFEGLSRQFAVLEAMGWRRAELRGLLAWEGALLGAAAVVLGIALDAACFPVIRGMLSGVLPGADVAEAGILASAPVWVAGFLLTLAATQATALFLFRGRAQERLRGLG